MRAMIIEDVEQMLPLIELKMLIHWPGERNDNVQIKTTCAKQCDHSYVPNVLCSERVSSPTISFVR